MKICITRSFGPVKTGANLVIFSDHKNVVPEFAARSYLEECRSFAASHQVFLIPWMFSSMQQLCLCLISPAGEIAGVSRAASLSMQNAGSFHCSDDIDLIDTVFGRLYLSVDVDIYSPQLTRLAALRGAEAIVSLQYLDPFDYTGDQVMQGAWNAAQANDLWVVSVTNMGGAVLCPWDDTLASDGYVLRPNDFFPISCRVDLDKFGQIHTREHVLNNLNLPVLETYKELLSR